MVEEIQSSKCDIEILGYLQSYKYFRLLMNSEKLQLAKLFRFRPTVEKISREVINYFKEKFRNKNGNAIIVGVHIRTSTTFLNLKNFSYSFLFYL